MQHLISPYINTAQSFINTAQSFINTAQSFTNTAQSFINTAQSFTKITKIEEMIINLRSYNYVTNSPCQYQRKCIESSLENMDTEVWV